MEKENIIIAKKILKIACKFLSFDNFKNLKKLFLFARLLFNKSCTLSTSCNRALKKKIFFLYPRYVIISLTSYLFTLCYNLF